MRTIRLSLFARQFSQNRDFSQGGRAGALQAYDKTAYPEFVFYQGY